MDRIELPSGGWIQLRDPEDFRDGDKEDMMRRIGHVDQDRPIDAGYDLLRELKLALIEDWHIPYLSDPQALPIANPKLLRELKIRDSNALEPYVLAARALLFPAPPSPDQYEDKASPTAPASA